MSRNTSNKNAAPRKSGSPLLTGILVGMVIGVAMAAGLAWFLLRSPSPFVAQESVVAKRLPETPQLEAPKAVVAPRVAAVSATAATSSVADAKPRFEFYKVLTDKQEATIVVPPKADKPKVKDEKPDAKLAPPENKSAVATSATPAVVVNKEPYFLQVGSFSSEDDAEKLKAKLSLLGMEVSVAKVTIPEKGVWHRVRVGPYKNRDEMNQANAILQQNGVSGTPTHSH